MYHCNLPLFGGIGIAKTDSLITALMVGTGPYRDLHDLRDADRYAVNDNSGTASVIDPPKNQVILTMAEPDDHILHELVFDSASRDIHVAEVYSYIASDIDSRTKSVVGGSITDRLLST
jgi:hypothetical protein